MATKTPHKSGHPHGTAVMEEPPVEQPSEGSVSEESAFEPPARPESGERAGVTPLAAPTDLSQLIDPDAVQGTRFSGPLLSGPKGQGTPGVALLTKRGKFTWQNGSFSIPIKFPNSAILLTSWVMVEQAFDGLTASFKVGLTAGDNAFVAPIDLKAATPGIIKTDITGLLTSSWTAVATLTMTGTQTVGKATFIIQYSVPAKVATT